MPDSRVVLSFLMAKLELEPAAIATTLLNPTGTFVAPRLSPNAMTAPSLFKARPIAK